MRRLVIRPGAIGDCLLSQPAIAHLAPAELWVPGPVVPLFRPFVASVRSIAATGIDSLGVGDLAAPSSLWAKLKSFDSVVSWYGANRPEFREALMSGGVACGFHRALPPDDYRGHAADFFLEQVGGQRGGVPQIDIHPTRKRNNVVIHPFSGSARKNWPLKHYRELAARLPVAVEWSAGPDEHLPEAKRFDDLGKLAAWIAGARLYIGNDSGITHLAAATGVPTLALFSATDPAVWGPRGEIVAVLRAESPDQLEIDKVFSEARRLLGSASSLNA